MSFSIDVTTSCEVSYHEAKNLTIAFIEKKYELLGAIVDNKNFICMYGLKDHHKCEYGYIRTDRKATPEQIMAYAIITDLKNEK